MAPRRTNIEAQTAYPCGGVLEVEGFEIEGTYDSRRFTAGAGRFLAREKEI